MTFINCYFLPFALSWSSLKQVFLFFLQVSELSLSTSLSKNQNKVEHAFIFNFSWEMADHIKINFLSQTEDNFPLLVQLPLPKIKFISACFLLYTIKEKLFSVWFWDPHRFLRSEHLPISIDFLMKLYSYPTRFTHLAGNAEICFIALIKTKLKHFNCVTGLEMGKWIHETE